MRCRASEKPRWTVAPPSSFSGRTSRSSSQLRKPVVPRKTSTAKAAFYRQAYEQAVAGAPGLALGAYAFNWGSKMEATSTWFGMFLEDGARTGAVDAMTELWSGSPPDDLAPTVEPLVLEGKAQVDPGAELGVKSLVTDPEGGDVQVRWVLRPEASEYATGGDFRPDLPDIEGVVMESSAEGVKLRMPDEPGPYRLFLYVYDGQGNAGHANIPFRVK